MSNCDTIIQNKYTTALTEEYNAIGLNNFGVCNHVQNINKNECSGSDDVFTSYTDILLNWFPKDPYPIPESVLSYQQNLALTQKAKNISTSSCDTPCKPNRMGAGRYYGSAANCKNDGTQGSCYMYSYPDPRTPGNPFATVGKHTRRFARNVIPSKANSNGLRLLFDNNKFALTNSSRGMVGTSSSASRAINRGRASARNAAKLSFKNSK
tara:strand:+ start:98 stop:727 length:630 start_codon:yes stop_codon:yes gene_type:complete